MLNLTLCFLTAVHVYAHTFNFELLLDAQESSDDLLQKLSNIGNNEGEVYVNPIRSRDAVSSPQHVKLRLHGTQQAARLRRDSRAANIKT